MEFYPTIKVRHNKVVVNFHKGMLYWIKKRGNMEVSALDEQSLEMPDVQQTYCDIRRSIVNAQHKVASAVNTAMVTAYWEVGEQIYKA